MKSKRCAIFNSSTQRKKFTVRIVPHYKIEEIEALDNRYDSCIYDSCIYDSCIYDSYLWLISMTHIITDFSTTSTERDVGYKFQSAQSVLMANSRQVRNIKLIEMTKYKNGLGFTITSRDIQSTAESPMLINRITPGGAASATDLKIGDRYYQTRPD